MEKVGLFPAQGKRPDESTNPDHINPNKFNEHIGKPQVEQLVEEVNEDLMREVCISHQITKMTT